MEERRKDDLYYDEQKIEITDEQVSLNTSYIDDKLKELEIIADALIEFALWRLENHPDKRELILNETRDWLFQKLGQGSIGPATAAADPLLRRKIAELEQLFTES